MTSPLRWTSLIFLVNAIGGEKDGEEITKKTETGSRDIYFSDMLITKNGYLIVGQTSSKELGGNNKDLISYFLKYDKNGKIVK
mgnify:CR=1 FL=1